MFDLIFCFFIYFIVVFLCSDHKIYDLQAIFADYSVNSKIHDAKRDRVIFNLGRSQIELCYVPHSILKIISS